MHIYICMNTHTHGHTSAIDEADPTSQSDSTQVRHKSSSPQPSPGASRKKDVEVRVYDSLVAPFYISDRVENKKWKAWERGYVCVMCVCVCV